MISFEEKGVKNFLRWLIEIKKKLKKLQFIDMTINLSYFCEGVDFFNYFLFP